MLCYLRTSPELQLLRGIAVTEVCKVKFKTCLTGPVKLIQAVKIAHTFFTVCVRSVPRYHFKLAYVILQMAVKDFETDFQE